MRFITVRDLRLRGAAIWKALRAGEEAILTSNGKPVAFLAGIDEERAEDVIRAFRQAKAQAAVARMREIARQRGLDRMSQDEIEAEIRAARQTRTR